MATTVASDPYWKTLDSINPVVQTDYSVRLLNLDCQTRFHAKYSQSHKS